MITITVTITAGATATNRPAIAALRAHTHTTVADFLASQGIPEDLIEQYGSAFGRYVAMTYRRRTGRKDPDFTYAIGTDGEWHRRWAYRIDDPLTGELMHLALRHYARRKIFTLAA